MNVWAFDNFSQITLCICISIWTQADGREEKVGKISHLWETDINEMVMPKIELQFGLLNNF